MNIFLKFSIDKPIPCMYNKGEDRKKKAVEQTESLKGV